jgi:hypothetical protein
MKKPQPSHLHLILIVAAFAAAPLAIYCGAYFALTCSTARGPSGATCRVYPAQWVALAFLPGCLLEGAITGRETLPAWRDPAVGPNLPAGNSAPSAAANSSPIADGRL